MRAGAVDPAGLVHAARSGRGGASVLLGGPGTGKSALLAAARAAAEDFLVLGAPGARAERGVRLAALHRLLQPVAGRLRLLPAEQAAALSFAAGRGGPPAGDFVLRSGFHALLAGLAAERPVLCWADDAHWWDDASLGVLAFAARRAEPLPLAVLIAGCPRRGPDPAAGLPRHALGGGQGLPGLTPQQSQICLLVASGQTNREIARRLVISHRTVDHHLRNVFTRLGVRSRAELAALVARRAR